MKKLFVSLECTARDGSLQDPHVIALGSKCHTQIVCGHDGKVRFLDRDGVEEDDEQLVILAILRKSAKPCM